ncbi:hypothetical protein EST38_g7865 [Candolleomyces aberdarensis]|uniref:Uncharacterized protein n=1 Tax=Candolleomyces aberdarensis TaxID=2316362 RepID=A0A4Q2DHG3_9AGAR|nr:hypothetical protein EST38_g7865 [Candolleomyces aberdarensis]
MDSFYDHQAARAWMEQYIMTCVQSESTEQYLTNLRVNSSNVTKHQEPRCLRLTEDVAEGTREVEVRELSVTGDEQIRMLRQFVKLSGLGSPLFEEMSVKIKEVWDAFCKAANPGTISQPVFKAYDGDYAVDAHTRYFTDRRHAPSLKHEEMPVTIDPHRHLDIVRGPNFIYSDENHVEYCQKNAYIDLDMFHFPPNPSKLEISSKWEQLSLCTQLEKINMC